jgi:hypothetical protein
MLSKLPVVTYDPGEPAVAARAFSRTCPTPTPPVYDSGATAGKVVAGVILTALYGAATPNQAAEAKARGWPDGQVGYTTQTLYTDGTSFLTYYVLPA